VDGDDDDAVLSARADASRRLGRLRDDVAAAIGLG
jgi:hypothetical protein